MEEKCTKRARFVRWMKKRNCPKIHNSKKISYEVFKSHTQRERLCLQLI